MRAANTPLARCINYATRSVPRAPPLINAHFLYAGFTDPRIHPCRGQRLQLQITQPPSFLDHRSPVCIREGMWEGGREIVIFSPSEKENIKERTDNNYRRLLTVRAVIFRRLCEATAASKTVVKRQWQKKNYSAQSIENIETLLLSEKKIVLTRKSVDWNQHVLFATIYIFLFPKFLSENFRKSEQTFVRINRNSSVLITRSILSPVDRFLLETSLSVPCRILTNVVSQDNETFLKWWEEGGKNISNFNLPSNLVFFLPRIPGRVQKLHLANRAAGSKSG